MRRALRFVTIAVVLATAGLTVAQSPPITSPTPAPSPVTPTTPSATPAAPVPIPLPAPSTPTPAVAPAQTIPAGRSTWRSQDGSIADLTIDLATGTLTGTFAPGFPCGLATSLAPSPRPLAGTVNGNAVAWTLGLSACPSVGTWIGHYQTAGAEEQLVMLWTLAVPESPPGVGSTLTGSALFVRQSP